MVMQNVQEIARQIVAREGGFVDDPDDPGGATKHGVTIGTMQRLGLDLDGDGRVDRADVRALEASQAVAIFVTKYFERPGIASLPEALQPSVFDMYVNAGAQAVRLLQTLLCDMGYDVTVDGVIGPQTAGAAESAARVSADDLVDAYGIARRNYYYRLAEARAPLRKYARRKDGGKGGWIVRAEEFISPRYRLSDVDHAKRVASWG
jgi:lysozyme family protein